MSDLSPSNNLAERERREPWWPALCNTPNRARVVFDFDEDGEHIHQVDEGLAVIRPDGWVDFWTDDQGEWQTWPREKITCIDWKGSRYV